MSHAESAANWAFGPWHFMKGGDPRHRKLEHLERLAAMRHLGEPFGGGGPMWGRGGPFGPHGRGRGRKRRGDVRTALLMLLAEEARNGYQLMQTIEERSGGRWRPSPGSVYPALAQLEDEGLVRAVERDGTKLFEITDAGREHVAAAHGQTAPWEMDDDPAFETLAELRSLVHQIANGCRPGGSGRRRGADRPRARHPGRHAPQAVPDPRRGRGRADDLTGT